MNRKERRTRNRRPELYNEVDFPEPMVSIHGLSALVGVPVETIRDEIERQGGRGSFRMPEEWIRAGRRRSVAYKSITGHDDLRGALNFYGGSAS